MKTPAFWTTTPGLASALLWPLSQLYRLGQSLHRRTAPAPYKAPVPVICVGNLTAGGNGKTPSVIALLDLINAHKLAARPFVLTRGYGGTEKGPAIVDPIHHNAAQVGEEPLLLARTAPVVVCADRGAGARHAVAHGADLLLMDDGLQNPGLHKDLRFVVIDGASGFGNGLLLPAGPLREPLAQGAQRADGFILIGEDRHNVQSALPAAKPVFTASIQPHNIPAPDDQSRYVAFAGLGRPEKFKETLVQKRLSVAHFEAFPDHHVYTARDYARLSALAAQHHARLITTEKDAIKLDPAFKERNGIIIVPIYLSWRDDAALVDLMRQVIQA